MKKSLTAGMSAVALVASAASVALVGGSTAHAAGEPSSAFGLEATGLIPIEATPFVESTDGSLVEDSLVEIPGDPVVNAGVVNVGAENGHAYASVSDITLGDGLLAELPAELTDPIQDGCDQLVAELQALEDGVDDGTTEIEGVLGDTLDAVDDGFSDTPILTSLLASIDENLTTIELALLCDMLAGDVPLATIGAVEAECFGDTGDTTVGDITLLGGVDADVDTTTIASALGVEDLLVITENRQTDNADGTFTVDGLVVQLLPGTDAEAEIVISSATCGEITTRTPPEEPEAPAPTPGPGNLPVTG